MAKGKTEILESAKKWLDKVKVSNDDTKPVAVALKVLENLLTERAKLKVQLDKTSEEAKKAAAALGLVLKSSKKAISAVVVAKTKVPKKTKTPAVAKAGKPDTGKAK